ncbi:MAG: hypothetical protein WC850_03660 [Candidatus Gracilibacteria bacterium]
MRYYIAYKFTGSDIKILKNNLDIISNKIKETGNDIFIFFRDIQNRGNIEISINDIVNIDLKELKNSEGFFAFVDNEDKSEGLLIEAGYAKALNKKFILAIKKGIDLRILRTIADEIIEFSDIKDLEVKIEKLFSK